MGTLDGRSVVVTGASSGIGEAVARRLVAEGALVTIGSRSETVMAGATWVPTDVADLTVWLASDEATFISGSLFTIDGGLTAQSPIGG